MPPPSPSFLPLLTITVSESGTHRWAEARLTDSVREDAAVLLASHIVWHRCDGAPRYYEAWCDRYGGGPAHEPEFLDCLSAFVASESIGSPDAPGTQVHLEGFVAEHIWHLLASENIYALGTLIRIDGPDWSVTDSGGDGLAVHRVDGDLIFRLWESKAHTGVGAVRDVVNGACRQINLNALRYLARFSKVGQSLHDEELRQFYGMLPEHWRAGASAAGGGVSVSTHADDVADCFANFPSYWAFANKDQRLGLVVVIENFSAFAQRVREHVWKGL